MNIGKVLAVFIFSFVSYSASANGNLAKCNDRSILQSINNQIEQVIYSRVTNVTTDHLKYKMESLFEGEATKKFQRYCYGEVNLFLTDQAKNEIKMASKSIKDALDSTKNTPNSQSRYRDYKIVDDKVINESLGVVKAGFNYVIVFNEITNKNQVARFDMPRIEANNIIGLLAESRDASQIIAKIIENYQRYLRLARTDIGWILEEKQSGHGYRMTVKTDRVGLIIDCERDGRFYIGPTGPDMHLGGQLWQRSSLLIEGELIKLPIDGRDRKKKETNHVLFIDLYEKLRTQENINIVYDSTGDTHSIKASNGFVILPPASSEKFSALCPVTADKFATPQSKNKPGIVITR